MVHDALPDNISVQNPVVSTAPDSLPAGRNSRNPSGQFPASAILTSDEIRLRVSEILLS